MDGTPNGTTNGSGGFKKADLDAVTQTVKDMGSKLGTVAAEKAEAMAERSKDAGVEVVQKASKTVGNVADSLQQDQPMIADYVRDAATNIDKVAQSLKNHTVADLVSMATEFGRKQPLVFIAGAALVGFALTRFVKSGVASGASAGVADASAARADQAAIGHIAV